MVDVSSPAVLLVEPYDDTREMYAQYFAACGFPATTVASGDEALENVRNADVVVTGIHINGSFDGLELVRRVHGQDAEKPVIVLTAYVGEPYRQMAQEAGCDAFLVKPCRPDVLADEIRRVLARSRELREHSRDVQTHAADSLDRSQTLLERSTQLRARFEQDR
jgi:DNA-binding response OmpR family regulator